MFDLTWLPDWLIVFAGLLIVLGGIAFLLMPFAVLGMRFRIARLEEDVHALREELAMAALHPVARQGRSYAQERHSPQHSPHDVTVMPWGNPGKDNAHEKNEPLQTAETKLQKPITAERFYGAQENGRYDIGKSVLVAEGRMAHHQPVPDAKFRTEPRLRWPPPK